MICTCGHIRETHQHYRKGSDCGACGMERCSYFLPRFLGFLRRFR